MNEGFYLNSIDIQLDSSVKSITEVAAMCLSGAIENGIIISQNTDPSIRICKDRIEFGKCFNPDLYGMAGNIMTNYYLEYGNLVYRFDSAYKHSFLTNKLDYKGIFAPSVPDNEEIFDMIYPRFA